MESDRVQAGRPLRWRYSRHHVYTLVARTGLVRTGCLLVIWEPDHLGKERPLDGGNLISRSHHAGCLLAHKVDYNTHHDGLQGAMYTREDSSVYDVPRNARCGRTSYGFLRPSTKWMLLVALSLAQSETQSAPSVDLVSDLSRASVMVEILSHVDMAVMADPARGCGCLYSEDS